LTDERVERRLAAILAADVAGYSRLMGADEEGTLRALKSHRQEAIDPALATHRGRLVKTTGDGMLVEFASVLDAVRCAVDIQRAIDARNRAIDADKRIAFRIGINLGDIIVDGDDIYGDGVNVAARLEALAEPGRICVSGTVHDHVADRLGIGFADLGEHSVKNIARPVRVYRVEAASASEPPKPALALPDKPSIAVLPFQNMSGDAEQEYFADGIVEDIITALSRVKWLFVIARNSSFVYKGQAVDVKRIGRELGVRYVLEGSVRKAGTRVRITGQLIDATTGAHIWADRIEGDLQDMFDLQDRVTASVVGAIEPAMQAAEIRRAQSKPTSSLDAYDLYLRALAALNLWTRPGAEEALTLCRKAIEIDPRYAAAYGLAARCCIVMFSQGQFGEVNESMTLAFARRAIEYGADDPTALSIGGLALSLVAGDNDGALNAIGRSLALNPNSAQGWLASGGVRRYIGQAGQAIEHFQRAMRLSPLDPFAHEFKAGIAWACFIDGRYEDACEWADKALGEQPRYMPTLRVKLIACGLLGRTEQAEATKRALLALDPDATITKLLKITPLSRVNLKAALAAYIDGLRKAGLPE
jgi:TolB-like protein